MPQPLFTARDLGELINALPALFGFPPDDSLVVLGVDGKRIIFGMRVDFPEASGIDEVAALAAGHLTHQQVEGAIVLAVGEPLDVGQRLVSAVEARLGRVRPVAGGWANDVRYWVSMDGGDPEGYAYRRTLEHPVATHAIYSGQEIAPSRKVLTNRVLPDRGVRRRWIEQSAPAAARRLESDLAGLTESAVVELVDDQLLPIVHDLLAERPVDDGVLVRLSCALTRIEIRDAVWMTITSANARSLVRVWLHVARCAPVAWTPAPLCLAAFASWLAGDGAMAVIAAERAAAVDASYSMAELMLTLATSGVSPREWSGWSAAS